jgi:urea carboxylase
MNGLDSIDEVKDIVFNASYLVMGLGDVYLGAPVATPVDPRHRLITTKYNPARTWTAENSVGIGGAYLCVYGMEGPGGYQFVGRTSQMWNRYRQTKEFSQPWLLRFFDQIRFYEVSAEELMAFRRDFPKGQVSLRIEDTEFSLSDYVNWLAENQHSIDMFIAKRETSFAEELQRWRDNGQFTFAAPETDKSNSPTSDIPAGIQPIETSVSGNVWKFEVREGDMVSAGQTLMILESMKMEIEIQTQLAGRVSRILVGTGHDVQAGQCLVWIEESGERDE